MSEEIVSQDEVEVKQECEVEWCHEPIFRGKACWYHFLEDVINEWDAEEPEEVDFIFGDPVDRDWYGYKPEEILA